MTHINLLDIKEPKFDLSLKSSKVFSLTIPSKLQTYMACARPIIGSIDGVSAKIMMNYFKI